MNERTSRKIPVTERQFLWVQDDDKGEVTLHVGPTMVSPTAADRVVVDDGLGGFREDSTGRPQQMVEVGDNQYAVLSNPLVENDGGANGKFKQGRNESRPLRNGTRAMIPGPCYFWLRPGQKAEVRDAHELASDQYLVVKVYGDVDKTAPFYEVTAKSATITRATAENVRSDKPSSTRIDGQAPVDLRRGQLIVIRGLDTQLYVPPTGVDIVPDTSVDDSGAGISAAAARQLLSSLPKDEAPSAPPPPPAYGGGPSGADDTLGEVAYDEVSEEELQSQRAPRPNVKAAGIAKEMIDQSARARHRKPMPPPAVAAPAPMQQAMSQAAPQPPGGTGGPALPMEILSNPAIRRALEKEARAARLIRRAVVLGEKEYCVIIDADGKREIKVGPARVFPGPYDQFMVKGSRARIYDAYELLPQRALWLRVIAPISKSELGQKLPRGVVLEKDGFHPGDELLLTSVSTFFFPFNEIEVLSPETGEAVVGNDHSRVFIESIGIDQKSGIYVRDLFTGEVRLVRGKQSYLVDPRKEVQITRTVPADDWNLWIGDNEPHKRTGDAVTSPWAMSIVVPHNTAVLATSADGQRVIEGPCVTLLGYEETLTPIQLSTGTPKSDDAPLRTCFLRTVGNRVSDVINVETADFVRISVRVSYSVTFLPDHKARWFNHVNYIQVMVEHLRSLLRARCRSMALSQLWPRLPDFVRDTILGDKTDKKARPGRIFEENGTHVTEVEVLTSTIEDKSIAELMQRVQTQSVTLQIGDRQAQEQLISAKLRDEIAQKTQELNTAAREREAKLAELTRKFAQQAALEEARAEETLARERQKLADEREAEALKARWAREAAAKDAELKLLERDASARAGAQRTLQTAEMELQTQLRNLEILLIQAQSAATVAERQAVQRGLIEAMTALGDKILLGEAAANMNLVSLFKGKDVASLLSEVLGGTKVMPTVRALIDKFGTPANGPSSAPTPTDIRPA
jgi:major vault protein